MVIWYDGTFWGALWDGMSALDNVQGCPVWFQTSLQPFDAYDHTGW